MTAPPNVPATAPLAFDVVGVGNAIVDVLTHVDDAFLAEEGLVKGAMGLIDTERAESLYAAMPQGVEASGGAAANTIAGVASFGGRAAYIGRVRDDQLGDVFAHDLRAAGVSYDVAAGTAGPPTARCLIVVTPDGERTMSTFLGASAELSPADVDVDLVAAGAVAYCEGFLWDAPDAKAALAKAMDAARAGGRLVAFALSDRFCVERHRAEFLDLVTTRVDVLFANEDELRSLYEIDDLGLAVDEVGDLGRIACITRGAAGSLIVARGEVHQVHAHRVVRVVDTTGAGDLYAAGFLHGLTTGRDLVTCGRLASLAAAEVISHVGARPVSSLADLAASILATG